MRIVLPAVRITAHGSLIAPPFGGLLAVGQPSAHHRRFV
jgi:hypothetical protein